MFLNENHNGVETDGMLKLYKKYFSFINKLLFFYLCYHVIIAIQQSRDPIGYTKRTRRYSVLKAVHTPEGDQSSPQSDIKDVRAQTSEVTL